MTTAVTTFPQLHAPWAAKLLLTDRCCSSTLFDKRNDVVLAVGRRSVRWFTTDATVSFVVARSRDAGAWMPYRSGVTTGDELREWWNNSV
jgi:hypothetical protein